MQSDGSVGPESNGARQNPRRQLKTYSAAPLDRGKTGARPRQPRPVRISYEDPRPSGPVGIGTSAIARGVLLGGMLLAIVGVVHASWPPAELEPSRTVSEEALSKQIAQLKAELDQERAEKSELADKLASVEEKAPPPQPPAKAVAEPVQLIPQAAVQKAPVEAPEEPSLPQPMAPSVELMLSDTPVSAVPVGSSSGDAAGPQTFGIHLASFADRAMAERGWALLQRNHSAALGPLRPRIEEARDDKGNGVFLLIAGPFDTEEQAAAHCGKITTQVVFCRPRPFVGSDFAAAIAQ